MEDNQLGSQVALSPTRKFLVKRDPSSLSSSPNNPSLVKSPKKKYQVLRKLTEEEERLPRSPTKSLLPRRDEEGDIIEHTLLGATEEYENELIKLEDGEIVSDSNNLVCSLFFYI